MKKYFRSKTFTAGFIIVSILAAVCILSIFYTPYPPNEMYSAFRNTPPCGQFLFGTDNFGRDILSRIMTGSQTAFIIGFFSVAIGMFFGILLGAAAGFYGGLFDILLTRIIDVLMAFPTALLALMFIAVFGSGTRNTLIVLGIMTIPRFARLTRGEFMKEKVMEYVDSARLKGANDLRIIFVHILPNIESPLIVNAAFSFSLSVMTEAGLSYLGLGVAPPDPSWGRMLSEAQIYMQQAPWYPAFTGLSIIIMVLGFNLLGDGINEAGGA
ncbi:ABC transporter permease [Tyzzerella sp. OttesenSCG-928-J15]|nr:ABC transporter permease [Tyzzerella sp. OttesenSCG-928-J15]